MNTPQQTSFKGSFATPLGPITLSLAQNHSQILAIQFGKKAPAQPQGPPLYQQTQNQIQQYAQGHRPCFNLPYLLQGTPFQLKVWQAIAQIPYGKKCSYQDLAITVKSPLAFRAVGSACNKNPLPLIIPCHRVVGSGGQLTGFSAGIALKNQLLCLENSGT